MKTVYKCDTCSFSSLDEICCIKHEATHVKVKVGQIWRDIEQHERQHYIEAVNLLTNHISFVTVYIKNITGNITKVDPNNGQEIKYFLGQKELIEDIK